MFNKFLNRFPLENVKWLFGYGSAVFKQRNASAVENRLLDLILVVNSTLDFHRANLEMNYYDYSFIARRQFDLGCIGPFVNYMHSVGGRSYFNTEIGTEVGPVKYAVIGIDAFKEGLGDGLGWIAARLHKPIHSLHPFYGIPTAAEDYHQLDIAPDLLTHNQIHALKLGLASLHSKNDPTAPIRFDWTDLMLEIAGLSYSADIRSGLAEDPEKAANIVHGEAGAFMSEMYSKLTGKVQNDFDLQMKDKKGSKSFTCTMKSQAPLGELEKFKKNFYKNSMIEAMKAAITVGPDVSIRYMARKISKRIFK